jgi:glycosyltransferase involved in cell wall biosynthesis
VLGDIDSLRENWDGAALFVDPEDQAALADAVQSLIDAPTERAALGQAAVRRAATFTIERTAGEYFRMYERLIA